MSLCVLKAPNFDNVQIKFTKRQGNNQLTCHREDGTTEMSRLGPGLPYHDMAHYVVESQLNLTDGFYGNISKGYTVAQLSDKEVIKTLPVGSLVAEIVTRALQSLSVGGCDESQFADLVHAELAALKISHTLQLNDEQISAMRADYDDLVERWNSLPDGGILNVEF